MSDLIELLRQTLPGVAQEECRGDNLAILLASYFEPGVEDDELDDSGTWKQGAIDASNRVLDAIHAHYATALSQEREAREKAESLADRLRLAAKIHAGEARGANATINEAYQAVTGGTGEPGNWNGAEPIKRALAETRASLAEAKRLLTPFADVGGHFDGHVKDDDIVPVAMRNIRARHVREAARFLSQEPNHER